MSFQERRSIVNIIGTILISVAYSAFMVQRYPVADPYSPEIFRFWASFMLILIPVSIVAKIITYIVFYIVNTIATRQEESALTDERDKLIEQRSQLSSGYIFIIGFMLAMVALLLGMPPAIMFIIFFVSGLVTEIINEIAQFRFYRRGF